MTTSESAWTIEGELIRLSHAHSLNVALVTLKLSDSGDFKCIELVEPWRRGGAETYNCRFEIHLPDGQTRAFILKACVAFAIGGSLQDIVEMWVSRRALLAQAGVATPKLYCSEEGEILEDFIPHDLVPVLKSSDDIARRNLLVDLGCLAGALDRLGFAPIDAYSDLRTDGSRVYCIDFGEDLGPSGRNPLNRTNLDALFRHLESNKVSLTATEHALIERAFTITHDAA